eukprot:TRINITY_DN2695_c0_g1_i1.p1 TRINITY_DN2695_c0_g1~~TRINITY_DN2695_c0_g1_i1.p1  ORF type:complete len:403 (+),score=79.33 TRINITY_DN2695_c0_g1_i1:11-1219(+)
MKCTKRQINDDGSGVVTLIPQEQEDLWHVVNLITLGDHLKSSTWRRIQREGVTGTKDNTERKKITLTLSVEQVDFTPEDGQLRISGRNCEESKWVKNGAYHTIVLELNKSFTLTKSLWDEIALQRLDEACNLQNRAEVAALLITEGLANICLLTESMTITVAQLSVAIPRKRVQSAKHHDAAMEKFFDGIHEAIQRTIRFDIVKCFIIAGPGFVKDQFYKYLMKVAVQKEAAEGRKILENRSKILMCNASNAHKGALKEILSDKVILEKMQDTKAAKEVAVLQTFFEMLQSEPDRATYGHKPVQKACEQLAIETLMISDSLFRSQDRKTRDTYVQLIQKARDSGAVVLVFSSLHISGAQLDDLTGIAAILRFPMPNLEDSDNDESDYESSGEEREKAKNQTV